MRARFAHHALLPTQALQFYSKLQCDDGHWAGDYGGPFFLLPGLVIVCHMTKVALSPAHKDGMLTYMLNHQQLDGGWGLHIEGPSTMFGTVMQYVACRTLGMHRDAKEMCTARDFIHLHGGAVTVPSWCKFWLCVFGVYEWSGLNSIPPELWLLPTWFPFHPWRMWCHARMVYLPMSYLYGARVCAEQSDLRDELREELYVTAYDQVDWDAARNSICPRDLYSPHTQLMDAAFEALKYYEKAPIAALRNKALHFAAEYCHAEDLQTNFVDIGPVNKAMNMLVAFHVYGGESAEFKKHEARVWDYLWVAEDGVKMQGYNGSQLWDTAFAIQAIEATGMGREEVPQTLQKTYEYFDATQSKEDVPDREKFFRIISKGGWPFSTNDHGWPIADCTSEGLKGVLAIHRMGVDVKRIPPARLFDAVNLILEFQNGDGGWATYERNRGYNWFEWLNPAEVFGDIMIDYTYTELTSACVTALTQFQQEFPSHRASEVSAAVQRGVRFVRAQQRSDGSFYGSWAICFTYGTWFGVEALVAAGNASIDRPALEKACDFLVGHQNADGGWGESYLSCVRKQYVKAPSTTFNTSWALLALVKAQTLHTEAVERGIHFLLKLQEPSGDWPQQSVAGIFNRTCGITYTAYRNVFPIWALGAYRTEFHTRLSTSDALEF